MLMLSLSYLYSFYHYSSCNHQMYLQWPKPMGKFKSNGWKILPQASTTVELHYV